eukprot:2037295-Rhodomonas_salina.1
MMWTGSRGMGFEHRHPDARQTTWVAGLNALDERAGGKRVMVPAEATLLILPHMSRQGVWKVGVIALTDR